MITTIIDSTLKNPGQFWFFSGELLLPISFTPFQALIITNFSAN